LHALAPGALSGKRRILETSRGNRHIGKEAVLLDEAGKDAWLDRTSYSAAVPQISDCAVISQDHSRMLPPSFV